MGNIIRKCISPKPPEEQRELTANEDEFNSQFQYTDNAIKTSYYTWWNFILKNLFEQFHRVVNIYFIITLILTCIPVLSSLSPITTILPIVFVLGVTAIKDGYDDVKRHKSDNRINNRKIQIVKDGKLEKVHWNDIKVGNIVLVRNNDGFAADLLLLSTSDDNNQVYIETAELDGETNLKVRQPLPVTRELGDDLRNLSSFKGKIVCEAPNNRLDKFSGNLEVAGEKFALDNGNILLRGCIMRNTDWCYGLVVFAGPETKLMQNAGRRYLKRTSIEKLMNTLVWWIFLTLIVLSALAAILHWNFETKTGETFQVFLPRAEEAQSAEMSGFLIFWSYIILLNTLVPISLFVSVELIRLMQSYLIDNDIEMYYEKKNLPAESRTTTLNEELGQVQYIFSDKTGTLTQNVMCFKKCSISGIRFGDVPEDMEKAVADDTAETVNLGFNSYAEDTFRFYDNSLVEAISKRKDEDVCLFFTALSLCHTSLVETSDEGEMSYRAESPDEGALVSAARNFGFVFKGRTFDTMTIEALGEELTYKVVAVLEFNSDRKRMSVVLKTPEDKIVLFCKGADNVVLQRLKEDQNQNVRDKTLSDLDNYANTGLRTLCVAMKVIEEETFSVWNKAYQQARQSVDDKEDKLSAIYEELERDMTLLGATAIEDKLQDGVPETIKNLSEANIKIWVLTGDKQETAINIGYSCNMLTESMEKMIIKEYESEQVGEEIEQHLKRCADLRHGAVNMAYEESGMPGPSTSFSRRSRTARPKDVNLGLIVNGHSLFHALEDHREKFLELSLKCTAVICCRATPLQKAKVVELIKKSQKAVTLAIGDGANDVSMIKAAHIGVGISGEEGTQAVLSSDFSLGQFRYLQRLLLVHGKWSYVRICVFLGYFFYKNFAFTLVHFWFSIFSGFSAQSVYDDWFVSLYNTIYTFLPIMIVGIFEQDASAELCVKVPKLYMPGQTNEYFNKKLLVISLLMGVYHSLCIYFITFGMISAGQGADGKGITDLQFFSSVVQASVILVVTIQAGLETSYWTSLYHYVLWLSVLGYFLLTLLLTSNGLYTFSPSGFPFVGATTTAYAQGISWLTILLTIAVCLLPVIAVRYVRKFFFASKSEKEIRAYLEKLESNKGKV